jgi:ribosomal protein S14
MCREKHERTIIDAVKEAAKLTGNRINSLAIAMMLESASDSEIEDMVGYVTYVKDSGQKERISEIPYTIAHDVNGIYFSDQCFLPRTDGYRLQACAKCGKDTPQNMLSKEGLCRKCFNPVPTKESV